MRQSGLLDGKEEVRTFLNGVSDHKLKKYIVAGMPVLIDRSGKWLAHRDNIDDFFKFLTRKKGDSFGL